MNVASETHHLRLLVALAETGTLHAAAKRLHLTPSALSQQLRELEQRLGGALFDRSWRRLTPNAAGRRLTAGATEILRELARVEEEARSLIDGAATTLRIAMVCHQSYRWLPDFLAEFAQREPAVELSFVDEGTAAPADWLLAHKLDAALLAEKQPTDRRLRSTRLFRDELVAVVNHRHPWAKHHYVEPQAFAREQLISDEAALKRDAVLGRALAQAGDVIPKKMMIVPMSGTAALDLARVGLGVTVMPRWTVAPLRDRKLRLVRIAKRGLWLDWWVVTRRAPAEASIDRLVEALLAFHVRRRKDAR
jgi:LysR family transcriptional regulator for metE and metH